MNTRKRSVRPHTPTTLSDSSAADSAELVTVEASHSHDARAKVANQDSLVETRGPIVNPLWMVTVGLAILLALLAILSVSG